MIESNYFVILSFVAVIAPILLAGGSLFVLTRKLTESHELQKLIHDRLAKNTDPEIVQRINDGAERAQAFAEKAFDAFQNIFEFIEIVTEPELEIEELDGSVTSVKVGIE